jgi:hypothetical protein
MDLVTLLALYALGSSTPDRRPAFIGQRSHAVLVEQNSLDRWQPLIAEAARRFGIPEAWIRVVMEAESGGETMLNGRPITSSAGAMGLMQVMPDTYAELRTRFGLGPDPYDPRDNIYAGAAYLRTMYDRYGYPALFAAYNAGPAQFDAYLFHGTPLPGETWDYLAKIGSGAKEAVLAMGTGRSGTDELAASESPNRTDFASGRALFFVGGNASDTVSEESKRASQDGDPGGLGRSNPAPTIAQTNPQWPPEGANLFVPILGNRP